MSGFSHIQLGEGLHLRFRSVINGTFVLPHFAVGPDLDGRLLEVWLTARFLQSLFFNDSFFFMFMLVLYIGDLITIAVFKSLRAE